MAVSLLYVRTIGIGKFGRADESSDGLPSCVASVQAVEAAHEQTFEYEVAFLRPILQMGQTSAPGSMQYSIEMAARAL